MSRPFQGMPGAGKGPSGGGVSLSGGGASCDMKPSGWEKVAAPSILPESPRPDTRRTHSMSTILDRIVARKPQEIAAARARVPDADLERRIASLPPARDFRGALLAGGVQVIAE